MAAPQIRVLRVLPSLGTGGAEQQCLEVADHFNRQCPELNIRVDITTLFGPESLHTLSVPAGTTWHQLNCPRGVMGILRAAGPLAELAKEYDLVHALLWPSAWALALKTNCSAPAIVSIHGSAVRSGFLGLKGVADRWLFKRVDQLGFNSVIGRRALAAYYGHDEQSCFVVPNGKSVFRGPWPERSGLLVSARFEYPKRYDVLLDALKLVNSSLIRDTRIAGQHTDGDEFHREIDERNLADIQALGVISNPVEQMAAASIVALPTDHEGMPNTILEAWNAKAAVLASKVPGVQELVRHGIDGYLVENTPEAWAHGIETLLRDESLRLRLASEGHQRLVEEFSMDKTVSAWAGLYRSQLVEKPGSSTALVSHQ